MSVSHQNHHPSHSPVSSLSAASDPDLGPATMRSPQTKTLLVLSQSSSSGLMTNSPSLSNSTTTPSLTSVNTVLDHKSSQSSSPSVEDTVPKFSCAPETMSKGSSSFHDLNLSFSPPSPSPLPVSLSPPSSSTSPVAPVVVPPLLAFSCPSRQLSESAPAAQSSSPLPMAEPSLDEALDKLLAMSFSQNHTVADVGEDRKMEDRGMQEVQEELILPVDRNSTQPDTFTITDDSLDGGTDGNGDLDWADEELSMSFHDGLDGTMTPFTERPYTDGSMTPLTEASWMDESMTPSSCPGTPDATLDLPLLQTPTLDRVSASGHVTPLCSCVLCLFCLEGEYFLQGFSWKLIFSHLSEAACSLNRTLCIVTLQKPQSEPGKTLSMLPSLSNTPRHLTLIKHCKSLQM